MKRETIQSSFKRILLILVLVNLQLLYGEENSEKLCKQEINKEILDKTLVDKYCYETAKKFESKKEYSSASWYYLLSHNDKYNITNLKEYIPRSGNVSNLAHSYVLSGDLEKAKLYYQNFLEYLIDTDESIQDDYKLLFKLYPDKKEQLTKGLELWNNINKNQMDYLIKACTNNESIFACKMAGIKLYYKQYSLKQDFKKAKEFFKKVCDKNKNDEESCIALKQLNKIKEVPSSKLNKNEIIKHNGFEYKVIVSPTTGRKWLDRNLEAKRSCENNSDQECVGTNYYFEGSKLIWGFQNKSMNIKTLLKSDGTGVCPKGFKVPSGFIDFNLELVTMGYDEFENFLNISYSINNEMILWSSTIADSIDEAWFLHYPRNKQVGNGYKYKYDRFAKIRCVEAN